MKVSFTPLTVSHKRKRMIVPLIMAGSRSDELVFEQ
jgi:hypothetical protein